MFYRGLIRGLSAVGLAVITACGSSGAGVGHLSLDATTPLRTAFNADSGKVRAIFLASPTCGACLHGAASLEQAWLAKDSSADIAVYVVWSPQLGAKEQHVNSAATLVSDPRARHYWDPRELVGGAFEPVLGLPAPAWDTWMLFDRAATWHRDAPPHPAWWEHQLNVGPPNLHLDPERFASHAEALRSALADHR